MMTREGPAMQEIARNRQGSNDCTVLRKVTYIPPTQFAFILFVTHDTPVP